VGEMLLSCSWNKIYELAREYNILEKLSGLIHKRHNAVYKPHHTMRTFIGVRGKTFENAQKMYSGNKKEKGKRGYTLVSAFDTVNKLPMDFEVPRVHEIHAAPSLINNAISWEREGEICLDTIILDALYLNKELLDLLFGHKYIIRAPAQEWLTKYVDENLPSGKKEITLWGHKVTLYWKPRKIGMRLTNF
jgi:hypothetical protein